MTLRLRTPELAVSSGRHRSPLLLLILVVLLAGCSVTDDEDETPAPATLAPEATTGATTPATTPAAGATTVPASVDAAGGQTISDGICQTTIPDTWADDGTGRGVTASGAEYVLFGARVRSDESWNQAVELVKNQAGAEEGAQVTEGDDFVRVDFAEDRGFEYRRRFENDYCDFTVTSDAGPIPAEERASWDAIIASLAPVA
jgi:hypothetical protein